MVGSSIAGLTDDIWLEIFLHLPLKPMFKFRCVSKVWFYLLCDPYFVNKWIALNEYTPPWSLYYGCIPPKDYLPNNPMEIMFSNAYLDSHSPLFSCHDGFSFEFLNLNPTSPKEHRLYLLGPSNGLVLCATTLPSNGYYYVCNPLTQKWVTIPPPPPSKPGMLSAKISFEYELLSSSLISTRYKAVRILQFEADSDTFVVHIFSSDLVEWNIHEVSCPQALTFKFSSFSYPVTHNGVFYLNIEEYRMLVYNFNNSNNKASGHQCQSIDLPDRSYKGENHVYDSEVLYFNRRCIGVSEGLTCYAHIEETNNTLNVWVFEEKWKLLQKDIKLDDLLTEIYNKIENALAEFHSELSSEVFDAHLLVYMNLSGKRIEILGFSPVDKNVVMLGYKSYVWAYNIRTRRYEELCRPSFLPSIRFDKPFWMYTPFVFKPTPTILPQ